MHTKSDSEVTSLAPSSPRSPRSRPVYFVQSPSRDSHDGDSKLSFQSTPLLTPIGSPLHPAFSSRSRNSSSQFLTPPSRNKLASKKDLHPHPHRSHKTSKPWAAINIIHEDDENPFHDSVAPHIYMIFLILLSCLVFLILFILLFWLICRPSHPQLSLKNVVFHNFYMGEGADASGVPTKMVSLNCTVQLIYYNPSKYFGVHVDPVNVVLSFSELDIAKREILSYFQVKDSRKIIPVVVKASKVPIYGAGAGLTSMYGSKQGIPLSLVANLYSEYYVVGKMVKPKFQNQVSCNIVLDSNSMALLSPLRSSCIYNPPSMTSSKTHG